MSKIVKGVAGAAIGYATGGIGGALLGGVQAFGSTSPKSYANKAYAAEQEALKSAQGLQKYLYEQSRADLQPYQASGNRAGSLYESMLYGIPLGQTSYYDQAFGQNGQATPNDLGGAFSAANDTTADRFAPFYNSPDYQFTLSEGQKALDRSASARGMLMSGQQQKATQRFGQNLASTQYNNYMNRLGGLMASGQNAAVQTGGAAQNYGNAATGIYTNMANSAGQYYGNLAAANQGSSYGLGSLTSSLGSSGLLSKFNNFVGNLF